MRHAPGTRTYATHHYGRSLRDKRGARDAKMRQGGGNDLSCCRRGGAEHGRVIAAWRWVGLCALGQRWQPGALPQAGMDARLWR